jgi:hypothetical protein
MKAAYPTGQRMTQFGIMAFDDESVFTCHGEKKGGETDLGSSKAAPSLVLAHGHHEGDNQLSP